MKQIAAAFIAAKRAFAPALKNSVNPHLKAKYADLSACIEAVDSAFLDNGIVMYQETFECERGVLVETVLLHESGESIRCGKLHVPAAKSDAQGYGSALTYARRYSLMAACGIAAEDDDGAGASKGQKLAPAVPPELLRDARIAADGGWTAFAGWIKGRSKEEREALNSESDALKQAAKDADAREAA